MIYDEKAEKLEQPDYTVAQLRAGLPFWTGTAREWIARRRLWCIEQAETPRPVTDTFGDVHRDATELQKSMGLWQPDGNAFRKIKKHSSR